LSFCRVAGPALAGALLAAPTIGTVYLPFTAGNLQRNGMQRYYSCQEPADRAEYGTTPAGNWQRS